MMKRKVIERSESSLIEAFMAKYEPTESQIEEVMCERNLGAEDAYDWLVENYEPTDEELDEMQVELDDSAYDDYCDSLYDAMKDEE